MYKIIKTPTPNGDHPKEDWKKLEDTMNDLETEGYKYMDTLQESDTSRPAKYIIMYREK